MLLVSMSVQKMFFSSLDACSLYRSPLSLCAGWASCVVAIKEQTGEQCKETRILFHVYWRMITAPTTEMIPAHPYVVVRAKGIRKSLEEVLNYRKLSTGSSWIYQGSPGAATAKTTQRYVTFFAHRSRSLCTFTRKSFGGGACQ